MKYRCEVCDTDMCFGTTYKTLQYDVACHENRDYHKENLELVLKNKKPCVHFMLRSYDGVGGYQCEDCNEVFEGLYIRK